MTPARFICHRSSVAWGAQHAHAETVSRGFGVGAGAFPRRGAFELCEGNPECTTSTLMASGKGEWFDGSKVRHR